MTRGAAVLLHDGDRGFFSFWVPKRPSLQEHLAMPRLLLKHRLATRWLHWINFPILAVMIWSGLLIYWSNSVYRIGIGGRTLFHFFPDGFFKKLGIDHRLAEGMAWHFLFMWIFAINGLLYVAYTIFSGAWRELLPQRGSFGRAFRVLLHDLHLIHDLPPQGKYNDAQRIAYTLVIVMGAGSLLTGLAIYKPTQLSRLTGVLGGYQWARWEHFLLTAGYVLFFLIHIAQVIRAGWSNLRSMLMGYDLAPVPEPSNETVR